MNEQSFAVGEQPRLILTNCAGDIEIMTHDEATIVIASDDRTASAQATADGILVTGAQDNLNIRIPAATTILIDRAGGDLDIDGAAAADLHQIGGSVTLANVDGNVRIDTVHGDCAIDEAGDVQIVGILHGDLELRVVKAVIVERVEGDCSIERAVSAVFGTVGGDCEAEEIASELRYGSIGGEFKCSRSPEAVVTGGSLGGDADIEHVARIELGDIGGDAELRASGDIRVGAVGCDLDAHASAGNLSVGTVGGDAELRATAGRVQLGIIGGDLKLSGTFDAVTNMQATVGGDAMLGLTSDADVTIRATVGGEVRGKRTMASEGGMLTVVYGAGAGSVSMLVGGDLDLDGSSPRVASTSWGDWGTFGREMGQLGAQFGREMGQLGAQLGRDLGGAFRGNERWATKVSERAEELNQRVQETVREAETEARRAAQQAVGEGQRVRVQVGNREWRFDRERLDFLKQQAKDAAQGGVASAVEAVDRALAGMGVPPTPPVPPVAPAPDAPIPPAAPPITPATGVTMRMEQPAAPRDIEAERAAILQMIAEGRISPAEGDMLLEALG